MSKRVIIFIKSYNYYELDCLSLFFKNNCFLNKINNFVMCISKLFLLEIRIFLLF